jgi:hypothetical protein
MKTWVRKTLSVGVLTAGAILFAPQAAQADTGQFSVGNAGILNGNQAVVPVQVPVNLCGNGVGALIGIGVGISGACVNGAAHDVDAGGPDVRSKRSATREARTEDTTQFSGGNAGILNGNQLYVPIQVPINICGNGVGVLGVGLGLSGVCANAALNDVESARAEKRTEDTTQFSGWNAGIGNGNQLYVPIQVPINVCGNGVGVLGGGVGVSLLCANGALNDVESARTEDTTQVAAHNYGILNGNQAYVPIQVPINVCGNGVGALIGLGIGVSGACVNGAANDVDRGGNGNGHGYKGDDWNGHDGNGHNGHDGNGHDGYKGDHKGDHKGNGHHNGYKKSKSADEALPALGALQALPLFGDTAGLPLVGNLGSGLKTNKMDAAGIDVMSLLNG